MEIVLTPSPLERGVYSEEYEALVGALEETGFEVKVETPVEYRGGLVHEVIALTAQLGDVAADAYAIGKLVELLRANLVTPRRRGERDRAHVQVFDHRGDPLARVELPVERGDYGSAA